MSSASGVSQVSLRRPAAESTSSDEPTLMTMRRKSVRAGALADMGGFLARGAGGGQLWAVGFSGPGGWGGWVAGTGAFGGAFDQARNIGQHEFAAVDLDHAELRRQRGERIVGDLGSCCAGRGQKRRLAGVRQADQACIGDQLEAQPDPALLA